MSDDPDLSYEPDHANKTPKNPPWRLDKNMGTPPDRGHLRRGTTPTGVDT